VEIWKSVNKASGATLVRIERKKIARRVLAEPRVRLFRLGLGQ
jgi:hypothetical protein